MNLYTANLYYPSPVDGNIYLTYMHDDSGVLQPILIENSSHDELIRPYYLKNSAPLQPPLKYQAEISVKNGISNLCYYQPRENGQTDLLYCTSSVSNITLLLNSHLGQYLPVTLNSLDKNSCLIQLPVPIIENKFIQKNHHTIQAYITAYPQEIDNIFSAITRGILKSSKIEYDEYGFNISASDFQGNSYFFEKKQSYDNCQISSFTNYSNSKKDRLKRVKELRLQHRTQQEISEILNVSQKTISNDLKELNMS